MDERDRILQKFKFFNFFLMSTAILQIINGRSWNFTHVRNNGSAYSRKVQIERIVQILYIYIYIYFLYL